MIVAAVAEVDVEEIPRLAVVGVHHLMIVQPRPAAGEVVGDREQRVEAQRAVHLEIQPPPLSAPVEVVPAHQIDLLAAASAERERLERAVGEVAV